MNTEDLDPPFDYNLERIKASIESGTISIPPGLSREERRAFIRDRLAEHDAQTATPTEQ